MKETNLIALRKDIECLLEYVPWLTKKRGSDVSQVYNENNLSASSVPFPVYDSTLLSFVNEASASGLMDSNYVYVYSELGIRDVEGERQAIQNATVKDGAVLCGILSKYVMGGMRKGAVWTAGVNEGIFLDVLLKMKSLLEIWDAPLA